MQRALRPWIWTLVGGYASFLLVGLAQAQTGQPAGRFLSVAGEVRVTDREGRSRAAERTSEVREGDRIVTGGSGLAQLRMADGALVSVRRDSEVKLDQFAYSGQENDSSARFAMSIIQGGFRTITGLIGRTNRAAYRVSTPSATIGVRGTDYEVVHLPRQISGAPAGTYNRVYDGAVSLQNGAGVALLVTRDQTAFASLQGSAPVLVTPPGAVFGRAPTPAPSAPRSSEQNKGESKDGKGEAVRPGSLAPVQPRTTTVAPGDPSRVLSTPLEPARTLTTPLEPVRTLTTPVEPARSLTTPLETAPSFQVAPTTTTPASPALAPAISPVLAPAAAPTISTTPQVAPSRVTPVQTAPTTVVPKTTTIQR